MPQSLTKLYVHTVFSTKYRKCLIDEQIEAALHAYLAGICTRLQCFPIKIGGYKDHVHLLSTLSKKITAIKFIEELKSHSSTWIKTQDHRYADFFWQGGYGMFSVDHDSLEPLKSYIGSQHEHHKTFTFQEEYRKILREHNIDFDERYVWD